MDFSVVQFKENTHKYMSEVTYAISKRKKLSFI